jgi:hypothetical protein
MSIDKRLKRLEDLYVAPRSEAARAAAGEAEREEAFRIKAAILDAFASLSYDYMMRDLSDKRPLNYRDPAIVARIEEESVPRGLRDYGFSEEEVEELAPVYLEEWKRTGDEVDKMASNPGGGIANGQM